MLTTALTAQSERENPGLHRQPRAAGNQQPAPTFPSEERGRQEQVLLFIVLRVVFVLAASGQCNQGPQAVGYRGAGAEMSQILQRQCSVITATNMVANAAAPAL